MRKGERERERSEREKVNLRICSVHVFVHLGSLKLCGKEAKEFSKPTKRHLLSLPKKPA